MASSSALRCWMTKTHKSGLNNEKVQTKSIFLKNKYIIIAFKKKNIKCKDFNLVFDQHTQTHTHTKKNT